MGLKNVMTWGQSHIGCKRKYNEDRFLIKEFPQIMVLAVADGVAGNSGGEIAAQIVMDSIEAYPFSENNLKKDLKMVLVKAEEQIHDKVDKNPDLDGMGTTATIAVIFKNQVFWIHVGDSRMYLLQNDELKQITTDHTFIQDLIDDGTLTLEQAKTHPLRNMLDQCMGCGEIEPDDGVFSMGKGDRLLICSDGLTAHLSDLQTKIILKTDDIQTAGQKLIQAALERGGTDNVTVIVKGF